MAAARSAPRKTGRSSCRTNRTQGGGSLVESSVAAFSRVNGDRFAMLRQTHDPGSGSIDRRSCPIEFRPDVAQLRAARGVKWGAPTQEIPMKRIPILLLVIATRTFAQGALFERGQQGPSPNLRAVSERVRIAIDHQY